MFFKKECTSSFSQSVQSIDDFERKFITKNLFEICMAKSETKQGSEMSI